MDAAKHIPGNRFVIPYLLCAIIFVAFVLGSFASLVSEYLSINYNYLFEAGMVIGQVLFQWLFLFRKPFRKKWEYTYHLITVSFLGALLLVPVLLAARFYEIYPATALTWFFAVVTFMFFNHKRRVEKSRLPFYICYTWVLYRLLVLAFIVAY